MDHIRLVLLGGGFAVEGERRRKALRHVLRGNDVNGAVLHERLRLLRRQNDVLVVREHENVLRVDLLHRVGDVLRARVHRLPALDDAVDEQIFEDGGNPLARADGEHAHLLLFRLELGAKGAVLLEHVLDFDPVQFAEFHRVLQRFAGIVGVHMHLDEFQVADADDRIADLHQLFFQFIDVRKGRGFFEVDDKKFGAVGKLDFAKVEIDDVGIVAENILLRLACLGRNFQFSRNFLAVEGAEEPAVDAQKTHAARVDDARLFQNGQKFGRFGERFLALFDDRIQKFGKIAEFRRGLAGVFAHLARDRQNGALFGLGNGGIGDFCAVFHRFREGFEGDLLRFFNLRANAAEQLRQNDARISARALQSALGYGVAQFGKTVGRT